MEISYEKHGVEGVENCLTYLAACEPDYIESDELEIIGEDEEGREGSADISITNLAEEACKALAAQRKRIAELEEREAALAAHLEAIKSAAAKNYPQESYYAGDWISDLCQAIEEAPNEPPA